ncbi:unnamed protein product [Phaeothamnion confervicola]
MVKSMTMDPDKRRIVTSRPKENPLANAIRNFEGQFEFLSTMHRSSVLLPGDDEPYPTIEHAFQASKTEDPGLRAAVRAARTGIDAKKTTRTAPVTDAWRARSEALMELLVRDKFLRHPKQRDRLIATGDRPIVFENTHDDRIWGVCRGAGENKLGKLLEQVRADVARGGGEDALAWCRARFALPRPEDAALGLVALKRGAPVEALDFTAKPIIRVGKHPDNDVVLEHPTASRWHALIVLDLSGSNGGDGCIGRGGRGDRGNGGGSRTGTPYVVCLGAANGTFVGGKRLEAFAPRALPVAPPAITAAIAAADAAADAGGRTGCGADVSAAVAITAAAAVVAEAAGVAFGVSARRWVVMAAETTRRDAQRAALLREMAGGITAEGGVVTDAAGGGTPPEDATVYVSGLAKEADEVAVAEIFEDCGEIHSVRVLKEAGGGLSRGIAFVSFRRPAGAVKALMMDGEIVGDGANPIKVRRSKAKPHDDGGRSSGGGGRGSGGGRGRGDASGGGGGCSGIGGGRGGGAGAKVAGAACGPVAWEPSVPWGATTAGATATAGSGSGRAARFGGIGAAGPASLSRRDGAGGDWANNGAAWKATLAAAAQRAAAAKAAAAAAAGAVPAVVVPAQPPVMAPQGASAASGAGEQKKRSHDAFPKPNKDDGNGRRGGSDDGDDGERGLHRRQRDDDEEDSHGRHPRREFSDGGGDESDGGRRRSLQRGRRRDDSRDGEEGRRRPRRGSAERRGGSGAERRGGSGAKRRRRSRSSGSGGGEGSGDERGRREGRHEQRHHPPGPVAVAPMKIAAEKHKCI